MSTIYDFNDLGMSTEEVIDFAMLVAVATVSIIMLWSKV